MDIGELFKRNSLLFESYFGNILFLKSEDVKFLHAICDYYFDPDKDEFAQALKTSSLNSPLYDMLHKESLAKLKNQPRVFWEADKHDPDDKTIGYMIASTNGYVFENSKKYVLTKVLRPERVLIFLPLVLDWAQYYLPKSVNDSINTRNVLHSVQLVLKNQSTLREVIIVNTPNEISAVLKEPND
jgi:hypothetical protein